MGRKVNVSEVIGKSKLNGFMYGVIAIGVIMILFDGYDMGVWAGTLTSLRTDTGIEDVTLGFTRARVSLAVCLAAYSSVCFRIG